MRNNREHENLEKEIEYQNLEIELCEKHMREYKALKESKTEEQKTTTTQLAERKSDLEAKR